MKPRNRVHTIIRWPSDPRRRLELAETDIEFCKAIEKVMGTAAGLERVLDAAVRAKVRAQQQLER